MHTKHTVQRPKTHLFKISLALALTVQTAMASEHFFTPAEAAFAVSPKEVIHKLRLTGGTAEAAQKLIDAARKESPEALLQIEATGKLKVGAVPLRLGSRMMLVISPGGGVTASAKSKATSLISIARAETVSISSSGPGHAVLDGGGSKTISGIVVAGGKRINLDQLSVIRCGKVGIDYLGGDAEAVNEAGSVTRCHFQENGNGLQIDTTAGFMCLDNEFKAQSGTALAIDSLNSVVAGNHFSGNHAAIVSGSDRGVITRNEIGDSAALELTAASTGNLVSENRGTATGLQLKLAGSKQQLFHNDLQGNATLAPESQEILLMGNAGLQADPTATGLKLFNPPTFDRPHHDPQIVAGMGRFDLTVPGGISKEPKTVKPEPVDLDVVQKAVDQARAEHPNDVIALKLEGKYISRSPNGLKLPPNTCLILDGLILADHGTPLDPLWVRGEPVSQIIQLPSTGYSSVSGGKLDGGRQASYPINANTGSTALIEGVTLVSGARDGIYTKARDSKDPLFIFRCSVIANNGRGIWAHVASRIHSIANFCVGNKMDGIDLDAGANDCTALFNVSSGNGRHGVFIEEAVNHQIVFGNTLSGNGSAGVHVWNEEVKGNTGLNVIAANECGTNRRGVSAGGRADDRTANGNLFFNNVCRQNRLDGASAGNSHAKGNYFSQCVVGQNLEKDLSTTDSAAPFFFNLVTPTAKP